MGVTLAGVVTTIILFATADYGGDDQDGDAAAKKDRLRFGVDYAVTPAVDPRGGAGALVTGRF